MQERYEILGKLNRGGMSTIYRARDTVMGREVAIKRLLPLEETNLNETPVEVIEREAAALAKFQHPNIVTVFALEHDADGPYVVMELVEGQDLHEVMKTGSLTWEDFLHIAPQCLEPLVSAKEANLLHRDIKPGNIMLKRSASGKFLVKILDFGLAKFSQKPSRQTLDQQGSFLGSIEFIAPEQLELRPLDQRTDLYSLGCVLYFSLTQKSPFWDESPARIVSNHLEHRCSPIRELRPDVSEPVADWLMRLLSRKPEDRPEDAAAALREFQEAVSGKSPARRAAAEEPAPGSAPPSAPSPPQGAEAATGAPEERTEGAVRSAGVRLKTGSAPVARTGSETLRPHRMPAGTPRPRTGPAGISRPRTGPASPAPGSGQTAAALRSRWGSLISKLKLPGAGWWNRQRIAAVAGAVLLLLLLLVVPRLRTSPPEAPPEPPPATAVEPDLPPLPLPRELPDPPVTAPPPVGAGLAAHFRAAEGAFARDYRRAARPGEQTAAWRNLASPRTAESLLRDGGDPTGQHLPVLALRGPEAFPALRGQFYGLLLTNRTSLQMPANELDLSGGFTLFLVAALDPGSDRFLRLSPSPSDGRTFHLTRHLNGQIQAHFRHRPRVGALVTDLPWPGGGASVVSCTWTPEEGQMKLRTRSRGGATAEASSRLGDPEGGDVPFARLALGRRGFNDPRLLEGDTTVFEILLFERVLTEAETSAVEEHLAGLYFGQR